MFQRQGKLSMINSMGHFVEYFERLKLCRPNPYFGLLTIWRLFSPKRSYLLNQTGSFQLQVCLSMYDLFVDTRR